jgi:CDGSH-type Zn-finger protein
MCKCEMTRIVVKREENGPYLVTVDGKVLASLCGCGLSRSKPLCDRSHERARFTTPGAPIMKSEASTASPHGEPDRTVASSTETARVCRICGHANPQWVRNYCVRCAAKLKAD